MNSNKTKTYFKPYIFNNRDKLFNKKSSKWLKLILSSVKRLLLKYHISMQGNFGVFPFLRSWKLTCFNFSPPVWVQLYSKFWLLALFLFVSTSLKSRLKLGDPVNFETAVYLKSSNCSGRRKLEGFVWEKQLLSPSHARVVFHSTPCKFWNF